MARLWRAFRREQSDPECFYRLIAAEALRNLARYHDLDGAVLIDVGGASGYLAEEARARGARAFTAEPSPDEASQHGRHLRSAVRSDGYALALRDGCADIVCCSNVFEHVAQPGRLLGELVRVARPGGIIFVSFTTWYGPWGGHETSPWHYLGGEWAARRYQARNGRPPKNLYGSTMFKVTVAQAMRYLGEAHSTEVLALWPRYYPESLRWIVQVPLVREVLIWNLAALLRRRPG